MAHSATVYPAHSVSGVDRLQQIAQRLYSQMVRAYDSNPCDANYERLDRLYRWKEDIELATRQGIPVSQVRPLM